MSSSIWSSELLAAGTAKFAALARGITDAIERGDLRPGERLPTHRELARLVGVTVGTASHCYRALSEKGLIRGEVGRGTFVRYRGSDRFEFDQVADVALRVDLRQNYPVAVTLENSSIASTLSLLQQRGALDATVDLTWATHEPRHRQAGAMWLSKIGTKANPKQVYVHTGPHAAVITAMVATAKPGDVILIPALCYPGIIAVANRLALQVEPVAVDDEGLLPAALDAACTQHSPALVFCAPTVDSVTATMATGTRRRALAEVVRKHKIWLCEFEENAFLMPRPPRSIQSFAPDRVLLIGDTTRALSLGMRTSYLLAPDSLNAEVRDAVNVMMWLPVPLLAEVITQWIEDGTANRIMAARRTELATRHSMAKRALRGRSIRIHRCGNHLWLQLPRGVRSDAFVSDAEQEGIGVTGSEWFTATGVPAPNAVRICYGAARSRAELEWALGGLTQLLRQGSSKQLKSR